MLSRLRGKRGELAEPLIGCLIYFILIFAVGTFCVGYTFDYWASYIKGECIDLPYLPRLVAAVFLVGPSIPAAVITWLTSFVMDNPSYEVCH
jgi:hypothetical protein